MVGFRTPIYSVFALLTGISVVAFTAEDSFARSRNAGKPAVEVNLSVLDRYRAPIQMGHRAEAMPSPSHYAAPATPPATISAPTPIQTRAMPPVDTGIGPLTGDTNMAPASPAPQPLMRAPMGDTQPPQPVPMAQPPLVTPPSPMPAPPIQPPMPVTNVHVGTPPAGTIAGSFPTMPERQQAAAFRRQHPSIDTRTRTQPPRMVQPRHFDPSRKRRPSGQWREVMTLPPQQPTKPPAWYTPPSATIPYAALPPALETEYQGSTAKQAQARVTKQSDTATTTPDWDALSKQLGSEPKKDTSPKVKLPEVKDDPALKNMPLEPIAEIDPEEKEKVSKPKPLDTSDVSKDVDILKIEDDSAFDLPALDNKTAPDAPAEADEPFPTLEPLPPLDDLPALEDSPEPTEHTADDIALGLGDEIAAEMKNDSDSEIDALFDDVDGAADSGSAPLPEEEDPFAMPALDAPSDDGTGDALALPELDNDAPGDDALAIPELEPLNLPAGDGIPDDLSGDLRGDLGGDLEDDFPELAAMDMEPLDLSELDAPPPADDSQEREIAAIEPADTNNALSGGASGFLMSLNYEADMLEPPTDGQALDSLKMIAQSMKQDPNMRIKMTSYASGEDEGTARKISLDRGIELRDWFAGQGVDRKRINMQAFGPASGDGYADRIDIELNQ